MPIVSVYLSEELFQRLEKARTGKSRSSFIVSILAERLSSMEVSTPAESEKVKQDDPFERLREYEQELRLYEEARGKPDSVTQRNIAWKIRSQLTRHGLDDLPQDTAKWNDDQKRRFWDVVNSKLEDHIANIQEEIAYHKLDGIRHERCMKLVGLSLKQLRKIHGDLWEKHERSPTISEFASMIGATYQKARNIISLLGRDYGFVSEKERRRIEAEKEEPE